MDKWRSDIDYMKPFLRRLIESGSLVADAAESTAHNQYQDYWDRVREAALQEILAEQAQPPT